MCPYVSAHYDKNGILKFYHSGSVEHALSECGIQQGDPLGSILFALAFLPLLMMIADLNPEILVTAYADNVALVEKQSLVLSAVDQFVTMSLLNLFCTHRIRFHREAKKGIPWYRLEA